MSLHFLDKLLLVQKLLFEILSVLSERIQFVNLGLHLQVGFHQMFDFVVLFGVVGVELVAF